MIGVSFVNKKRTVSLIAFSGATPTNCGGKPLYKPFTPSWRTTYIGLESGYFQRSHITDEVSIICNTLALPYNCTHCTYYFLTNMRGKFLQPSCFHTFLLGSWLRHTSETYVCKLMSCTQFAHTDLSICYSVHYNFSIT